MILENINIDAFNLANNGLMHLVEMIQIWFSVEEIYTV
jgi:hypothetical protein